MACVVICEWRRLHLQSELGLLLCFSLHYLIMRFVRETVWMATQIIASAAMPRIQKCPTLLVHRAVYVFVYNAPKAWESDRYRYRFRSKTFFKLSRWTNDFVFLLWKSNHGTVSLLVNPVPWNFQLQKRSYWSILTANIDEFSLSAMS